MIAAINVYIQFWPIVTTGGEDQMSRNFVVTSILVLVSALIGGIFGGRALKNLRNRKGT